MKKVFPLVPFCLFLPAFSLFLTPCHGQSTDSPVKSASSQSAAQPEVLSKASAAPVSVSKFDFGEGNDNQPVTAPPVIDLAIEGFSPDHLSGTWAVGTSYNDGYELVARHWLNERTALDLMVGGNYEPGPGSQPNTFSTFYWNYGLGAGFRFNLARPVEDVFVQWIVQLSYLQNYEQQTDETQSPASVSTTQEQILNLYLGPGFEAFLPFWKNLSIEASVGINLSSTWSQNSDLNNGFQLTPNYSYTHTWQWSTGFGSNNTSFSIFEAAVHFYL